MAMDDREAQVVGTYVGEYQGVYAAVPYTTEDAHGVITDVNSGDVVAVPATHPNYRELTRQHGTGVQALRAVQRVFE